MRADVIERRKPITMDWRGKMRGPPQHNRTSSHVTECGGLSSIVALSDKSKSKNETRPKNRQLRDKYRDESKEMQTLQDVTYIVGFILYGIQS